MMMPIASSGSVNPLVQAWLQTLCWAEGQRNAQLAKRNSRLPPGAQACPCQPCMHVSWHTVGLKTLFRM